MTLCNVCLTLIYQIQIQREAIAREPSMTFKGFVRKT